MIDHDDIAANDEPVVQPVPQTPQRLRHLRAVWRKAYQAIRPALPAPRVRWPRLLIVAAFLLVVGLGAMLALINSPLLQITTVEVQGADVVSPAAVRQLAGIKGQHVLLADLDAARRRIRALPMVKDVAISRNWPSGVKVVIVERMPWGRWRANDTVWAIDSEGVVLEGPALPYDGPIVTQTSALPAIAAGARVDTTAVRMVQDLHERGAPLPLPAVIDYQWSLSDGLIVITEHGRIVFGGADGLYFKYRVWTLLEREAFSRNEPLLFADLRFGLRPRVEIGLNVGRGIRTDSRTTTTLLPTTAQDARSSTSPIESQQ